MFAGPHSSYDAIVASSERQHGAIDLLTGKDGEVSFDFSPEQLDATYLLSTTLASGVGGYGVAQGQVAGERVIRFKRVNNRILIMEPNFHFEAPANTPQAESLAASVGDSVWMALPIVAESERTKHVIVSASAFLGDFDNIGQHISTAFLADGRVMGGSYHIDPARSYLEFGKAFEKNVTLAAADTFAGAGGAGLSAADPSSLLLHVRVNLTTLPPQSPYEPRYADDRMGYFTESYKRFGAGREGIVDRSYVVRWDLSKGPVVFYLTREIPAEYRDTVRRALLMWNDAFTRAGHPHAVEVRDQPNDPNWDPNDVRYNTIRWASNDEPAFAAEGQLLDDPRTGEILHASVILDGAAIDSIRRGFRPTSVALGFADSDYANYQVEAGANAAYGLLASQILPGSHVTTDAYVRDAVFQITMHEAGHAFGLRHNFAGSTVYSLAELRDKRFTNSHGISGSVMDYLPVNLTALDRDGKLFQDRLGPWDYWTIEYGYRSFGERMSADAEVRYLKPIADQSSRPEYAYGTDNDVLLANGFDPHIQPYDISNDPLAFAQSQFELLRKEFSLLDKRYPRDDRSFNDERQAFDTLLGQWRTTAVIGIRYIGGIYTSKAHRGQPHGSSPFSAVPRSEQRRAFELIAGNVLMPAIPLDSHLVNDLLDDPDTHPGYTPLLNSREYDVSKRLSQLQSQAMNALFSPDVLNRLISAQQRVDAPDKTMSLKDLFDWTTDFVWDDAARANAQKRSLHRAYIDTMTAMMLLDGPSERPFLGGIILKLPPAEAQELSRYALQRADERVAAALRQPHLDALTRVHLADMQARMRTARNSIRTRF